MRQSIVLLHHAEYAEEQPDFVVEVASELPESRFVAVLILLFNGDGEEHADRENVSYRLIGGGEHHERVRLDVGEKELVQMLDLLKVSAGLDRADELLVLVLEHVDLNVVLEVVDEERHGVSQMADERILRVGLEIEPQAVQLDLNVAKADEQVEDVVVALLAILAEERLHRIFDFVLNGEIRPAARPEVERAVAEIGRALGAREQPASSIGFLGEERRPKAQHGRHPPVSRSRCAQRPV